MRLQLLAELRLLQGVSRGFRWSTAAAVAAAVLPIFLSAADGLSVVVKVRGSDHPWIVASPGEGRAPVTAADGAEVTLEYDPAQEFVVCAGGKDVATQCTLVEHNNTPINLTLQAGRAVRARFLLGKRPIVGASVAITPRSLAVRRAFVLPLELAKDRSVVTSIRTIDDGIVVIPALAPGDYTLSVSVPGGRTYETLATIPPKGSKDGNTVTLRDVHFDPGLSVTVSARAADEPVEGVAIGVSQRDTMKRITEPGAFLSITARTDKQGRAVLSGLDSRLPVDVVCKTPGFAPTKEVYNVPPRFVECVLQRYASIVGRVLDENNAPISGAVLGISGRSQKQTSETTGDFVLPSIVPGTATLTVSAPRHRRIEKEVSLLSGEKLDVGDLTLAAGDPFVGTVVDYASRDPVANARVEIGGTTTDTAVTGSDGRFELRGDWSGETVVTATAAGYARTKRYVGAAELQQKDGFVVELQHEGSINVVAWDESGEKPCANCTIVLISETDSQSRQTSTDGTTIFVGLAPGRYDLSRERRRASSEMVYVSGGDDAVAAEVLPDKVTTVVIGRKQGTIGVNISAESNWELRAKGTSGTQFVRQDYPGHYTLQRRGQEPLTLELADGLRGVRVMEIPAEFRSSEITRDLPRHVVRLSVTHSSLPAPGVRLSLLTTSGIAAWGMTDQNGILLLPYLASDRYAVSNANSQVVAEFTLTDQDTVREIAIAAESPR